MLINHFGVILCIFSVSYGGDSNNNETLQYILDQLPQYEETTCQDKIWAFWSLIKSNGIYFNISESNILEQSYDLQENIHGSLYKLDKDMLNKLEEYIGGKIEIGLNQNIPDKIDVAIINHKLYALNKLQTDIEGRIIRETKTLANDTLKMVNAEIERTLLELQNSTVSSKLDTLNAKVTHLENTIINLKLDTIEKRITETLTHILNENLGKMHKKPGLEQNTTKPDAVENTTSRNILVNRTRGYWDCKKRTVTGYDYSPVRMDSLNYASLESDERGLTYYEISFAGQGDYMGIQFSPLPKPGIGDGYFYLHLYGGGVEFYFGRPRTSDINSIELYQTIQIHSIPKTLSLKTYTAYHIKIKNQTIELYKMGNDTPILTNTDSRLRTVQYIGFTSWNERPATILYDCPPHFEGGYWDCKKRTVTGYDYSPVRMDSLNYASLESDERGLTYYEISFAGQGDYMGIQFSPLPKPGIGDGYFYLRKKELLPKGHVHKMYRGWYLYGGGVEFYFGRPRTSDINSIELYQTIQIHSIPKTLSLKTYTAYHIKIKNQTIELYKMGNDTPILTNTDSRLRTVQYIGFTSWNE